VAAEGGVASPLVNAVNMVSGLIELQPAYSAASVRPGVELLHGLTET